MDSLPYISPISSLIDAKPRRYIRPHRCYPSNPRVRDLVQPKGRSEPNVAVMPQTSNFIVPQPCAAIPATPAHGDNAYEHATASPASTYRDPGVLCDSGEVFDKSFATLVSHADSGTPRFSPSSPAYPASSAHHKYTSRTVSSSSMSSYLARADSSEHCDDLDTFSSTSTQPATCDTSNHLVAPGSPCVPCAS